MNIETQPGPAPREAGGSPDILEDLAKLPLNLVRAGKRFIDALVGASSAKELVHNQTRSNLNHLRTEVAA